MNPEGLVIFHNPRCSKSRAALQILKQRNLSPEIIDYLENPPTARELRDLLEKLGLAPRDLLRTTETAYTDAGLDDDSLSDDDIIEAICKYPELLQRPILVSGAKAVIGRPPARILEILA